MKPDFLTLKSVRLVAKLSFCKAVLAEKRKA